MKLLFQERVVSDLNSIYDYIADDNVSAAEKVIDDIYEKFETLLSFLGIGSNLSSRIKAKTDFKYIINGEYVILCKQENEAVRVYRVINAKQDILRVIFED